MTAPRPRRALWLDDVEAGTLAFCGATHAFRATEIDDLDAELDRLAAPDPAGALLKATVYLRDTDACARARARLAGCAAVELTVAPPVSGAPAAILEWRVTGAGVDGRPGRVDQPGVSWRFAAVERRHEPAGDAFRAAMTTAGAAVDADLAATLVRTWIYVGDITGRAGPTENYQAVNHARRVVFDELAIDRPYPASTGIGTARDLLSLGLLTCRDRGAGLRPIALENPRQTSAFAYPPSASEVPPLFSRAVALCARREALVLISGTASILESESVHLESAARQTEQTLANIGELLEPVHVTGRGFPASAGGLEALRACVVYVKRAADVAAVRAVCDRHLPPGVPTVLVLADVCRPELLVEIEGVAALSRGDDA